MGVGGRCAGGVSEGGRTGLGLIATDYDGWEPATTGGPWKGGSSEGGRVGRADTGVHCFWPENYILSIFRAP